MYAPASSLHRWVFNDAFSAAAEATTALDAPLCPNFSKNFESATFSRYKKTMMSVEARVYASDADQHFPLLGGPVPRSDGQTDVSRLSQPLSSWSNTKRECTHHTSGVCSAVSAC